MSSLNNGVWEYGTYSLYALDLLIISLFLGALFYKNSEPQNSNSQIDKKFIIIFVLFMVMNFLSIFWSQDKILTSYYFVRLLLMAGLLFIIFNIKISFIKASWALMTGGVFQAYLAIWQFFNQQVVSNKWLGMASHQAQDLGVAVVSNADGRWLRAYGTMSHPNILGGFLAICLLLAIYLWLQSDNNIKRLSMIMSLILLSTGLFFTFSRSAILGLIVALIVISFFIFTKHKPYRRQYAKSLTIIFLIFLTFSIIYLPLITSRVQINDRLEIKSLNERTTYQQQSHALLKEHWLFGVGAGNYTLVVYNEINSTLPPYSYQPVHNIYLLIFSELGIFGLMLFTILHFLGIKKITSPRLPILIYAGTLIIILVVGFFDHYFVSLVTSNLWFWLLLFLTNKNL
ncbi:MAG: O-antigen ligase family protein [Patescibacteria group bacterium]